MTRATSSRVSSGRRIAKGHTGPSRSVGAVGRRPEKTISLRLAEAVEMTGPRSYEAMLRVALDEARLGLSEGGIPIGAALFDGNGHLLGRGHNRRVQDGDPSAHAETDAFRKAGRRGDYRNCMLVSTLAPCWYCSGLVRQFGIGAVLVGESLNFEGGIGWLRDSGVEVIDLHSDDCVRLLRDYIRTHPEVWNEDIGKDVG